MEERRESIQHAGRPSALQCLDLPILLENYDLATVAKFRSVSTCSAFFDPGCPFSGFVPFCTRSYIYQNRFCALCNNVTEEIWPLREVFECPDYITKFTESLRKQRPVAFRELAIKMCHRVFQFPPECKAVAERMRCFVDKDDCVLTPNKTSEYYNACVAYSDPVYVKDKYYKNPFCFLCEGGKFEGNRCTDDTPIQQPFKFTPAFSFLLDLDGDHILSDFIQWQDNAASTNIAGTAAPAPYLTVLIIFGASISATWSWRRHENAWWRHQMETFNALLAFCAENSPDTGEFPSQRPVTRSLDAFFEYAPD